MDCPLCNTPLPDDAQRCTRCDWVRPASEEAPYQRRRDVTAFWLSLVPGLGHLYKGYILFGGVIFFLVGPAVLSLSVILATETVGLTFLILPPFLVLVMLHAYMAKDRRAEAIEKARALDQGRIAGVH